MSGSLALDAALAMLTLALAGWSVVTRQTFAAVVGFIGYGVVLTLVWWQLGAPDVALTEAAIGAGLTGALLIGADARLAQRTDAARSGPLLRAAAAAMSIAISVSIAIAASSLPTPAPTLAAAVAADVASTGVENPVTAVLMSFRAIDTLLEATVLTLALIGVWSLTRDEAWGARPGDRVSAVSRPDSAVVYLARVLPPIGLLVGIYVLWNGADHPGGKFQGATLIAAMVLLLVGAGLARPPPLVRRWLRVTLVIGPLVFMAIGGANAWLAGAFLGYPPGSAKPWILAIEFALMPSLVATLALLVLGPPLEREE